MNFIANLIRTKPYLNFFSSVKLAVPLMIVIILVVATGTIFESLYNSDYAKMAVYHTPWFFALMCLLWVNILFAALSRWPWNKNHIGFVTTHIGMLTLLVGSLVTASSGLDAQLGITEGTSNATMVLPETIVGYQFSDSPRPQTIEIPRGLSAYEATQDSLINSQIRHMFWIKKYLPFTSPSRVVVPVKGSEGSNSIGLSFRLKSQFFEVSEWLQSEENPNMNLGPAKLSLIVGKYNAAKHSANVIRKPKLNIENDEVVTTGPGDGAGAMPTTIAVTDFKSGKVIGEKSVAELKKHSWSVGGIQVRIKKEYHHATVSANKIAEGDGPENLALELEVTKGSESKREILFAKFSNFSINANGVFGFRVGWSGAAANDAAQNVADANTTLAHGSVTPPGDVDARDVKLPPDG